MPISRVLGFSRCSPFSAVSRQRNLKLRRRQLTGVFMAITSAWPASRSRPATRTTGLC
jgi:hypothetical protein